MASAEHCLVLLEDMMLVFDAQADRAVWATLNTMQTHYCSSLIGLV